MTSCSKLLSVAAIAAAALCSQGANAALSLSVIDSVNVDYAFGLAYDGTNVWYSDGYQNFRRINQNVPGMAPFGPTYNSGIWSALAFDGTNLAFANGSTISYYGTTSGLSAGTQTIGRSAGLIDGFDIEGGKIFWSPDVSYVAQLNKATGADEGILLSAAGGYSGVERVINGANDWLFVVNDATSPRKICRTNTAAPDDTFDGGADCVQLPNSRYEDLAFDGRYLYAADYYGGRIDKLDLLLDGGSIFVPPGGSVPEPATLALVFTALGGLAWARKKRST